MNTEKEDILSKVPEVTLIFWIIKILATTLDAISLQQTTFREEVMSGKIKIDGDVQKLIEFNRLFDRFVPDFPVVTPRLLPSDHGSN